LLTTTLHMNPITPFHRPPMPGCCYTPSTNFSSIPAPDPQPLAHHFRLPDASQLPEPQALFFDMFKFSKLENPPCSLFDCSPLTSPILLAFLLPNGGSSPCLLARPPSIAAALDNTSIGFPSPQINTRCCFKLSYLLPHLA